MKYLLGFLFGLLLAFNALAGQDCPSFIDSKDADTHSFMVSAVLRRNDADMTIRLAHAIEVAGTADAARGAFMGKAEEAFPEYSILSTLVTAIPSVKGRPCAPATGIRI